MEAASNLPDREAGVTSVWSFADLLGPNDRIDLYKAPRTGPVCAGTIVRMKRANAWRSAKWLVVTDALDVTTRLGRVGHRRQWKTRRIGPVPFLALAVEADGKRWLEVDGERTPFDPARHTITAVAVAVETPL